VILSGFAEIARQANPEPGVAMRREKAIDRIENTKSWDFLVIGGGATGLGVAVDAAARGYSVLLVEQDDFAKGTSSRSTKLVHGGVRYLKQGNISLVLEGAARARTSLRKRAPSRSSPLIHRSDL
jgi:glycerol-3-phosphate dehydrogenase